MKEIVIIVQSQKGIKKYDFDKDIISIGRSKQNDIFLEDEMVSNFHCSLTFDPSIGFYVLVDLNSKNGTFIGEKKIVEPFIIEKATLVTIGSCKLQIFPTEVKEGQKTVVFDLQDFKKNIPKEILQSMDEEKEPTIPLEKIKYTGEEKTIIEKKESNFILELSFIEGEHKGKNFTIKDKNEIFFGRSSECDFVFSDQRISRKHFKLKIENNKCYIQNLKPINIIYLNNEEVKDEKIEVGLNSIIKVQNEKIKVNYFEKTKEIPKKEIIQEKPKEFQMEIKTLSQKINYYILKGPLNIDYYYKLENSLLSNLPEKKWAIIDFKDISLIDYPALASLLKIIAEYDQKGGEIVLINISDELEKTFELVNVLRYLNKFRKENLEKAIKYLENKIT